MHHRGTQDSMMSDVILQGDPILHRLMGKLKWNARRIILFMSLLSALLFLGIGALASSMYMGSGNRFASPANLNFYLQWVFILSPLIWGAYVWQAKSTAKVLDNLAANGILGDLASANFKNANDLSKSILHSMIWKPNYVIIVLLIALFWFNDLLNLWPQQFVQAPEYWFEIKWYLPIHLFAYSIGLFVLFLFILRQVVFVVGLYRLFSRIEIQVKPLDPDESGGLGAIGDFAKSSLLFAIGLGLVAVAFGLFVGALGLNQFQRVDVLVFYGLYIILVPICLLAPIFSVRNAMLRARSNVLRPIAEEFQELLAKASLSLSTPNANLKDIDDKLVQLQRHRDLIMETYPTLPISMRSLRRFSLTATLPLVSGVLSLVLQLIK